MAMCCDQLIGVLSLLLIQFYLLRTTMLSALENYLEQEPDLDYLKGTKRRDNSTEKYLPTQMPLPAEKVSRRVLSQPADSEIPEAYCICVGLEKAAY